MILDKQWFAKIVAGMVTPRKIVGAEKEAPVRTNQTLEKGAQASKEEDEALAWKAVTQVAKITK